MCTVKVTAMDFSSFYEDIRTSEISIFAHNDPVLSQRLGNAANSTVQEGS